MRRLFSASCFGIALATVISANPGPPPAPEPAGLEWMIPTAVGVVLMARYGWRRIRVK